MCRHVVTSSCHDVTRRTWSPGRLIGKDVLVMTIWLGSIHGVQYCTIRTIRTYRQTDCIHSGTVLQYTYIVLTYHLSLPYVPYPHTPIPPHPHPHPTRRHECMHVRLGRRHSLPKVCLCLSTVVVSTLSRFLCTCAMETKRHRRSSKKKQQQQVCAAHSREKTVGSGLSTLARAIISCFAQATILLVLNVAHANAVSQATAGCAYTICAMLFLISEAEDTNLREANASVDRALNAKGLDVLCELTMCLSDCPARGHILRTVLNGISLPLVLYAAYKFSYTFMESNQKNQDWWLLCEMINSISDGMWVGMEMYGLPESHFVYGLCSWALIGMACALLVDSVREIFVALMVLSNEETGSIRPRIKRKAGKSIRSRSRPTRPTAKKTTSKMAKPNKKR